MPLDFEWPLKKVWQGYILPDELRLPTCPDCNGDGYSLEARALARTFYPASWTDEARALAWHDKIGQKEVDYLVEQGRLTVWRDGKWNKEPRTAAEVNAEERSRRGFGHDAINRLLLIQFRCDALGIPYECPTCEGHGDVGTPEQRQAEEDWQWTEPPTGDGWQLWETTTEGSPITPVCETPEELARWAADHKVSILGWETMTYEQWLRLIVQDEVEVGSMLIGSEGKVQTGVDALGLTQ